MKDINKIFFIVDLNWILSELMTALNIVSIDLWEV